MDRSLMIRRAMMGFRRDAMGVPPYTLIGSKGRGMHSLRIEGNTQRTVTIDGVEYVVPEDVTLLDSVTANEADFNLDFGIVPKLNTKARVIFTPLAANNNGYFGSRNDGNRARFAVVTFGMGTKVTFALTANTWSDNKTDITIGTRYDCTAYNGKQIINGTEYDETPLAELNTVTSFKICALGSSGAPTAGVVLNAKYEIVYIWEGETPVLLAHPAIKNNVAGYCDLVTGRFIAPTTGTLTAGNELPTPDFPLGCKGVGDRTENLFDKSTMTPVSVGLSDVGHARYATGAAQSKSFVIPIKPNTNYNVSVQGTFEGSLFRVATTATKCTSTSQIVQTIAHTNKTTYSATTINSGVNANYMYVQFSAANIEAMDNILMVVEGTETPTSYIPYGYKVKALLAQNCGCVDLGSLTWQFYASEPRFYTTIPDMKSVTGRGVSDIFCKDYTPSSSGANGTMFHNSQTIIIYDNRFTDAAAFKSDMSGKYLYYQRTTDASWVAPTPITIYTDKPLNKVGNYADVIDAIAGLKTDRVGVKVFDGTEGWIENGGVPGLFQLALAGSVPQNTVPYVGICTHFAAIDNKTAAAIGDKRCTFQGVMSANGRISIMYLDYAGDLAGFKAMLAAQYAAGTPVTVWYPLASATTGQVTGQSLVLPRGEVIVDSTNEVKAGRVGGCYQSQTND